MRSVTKHEVRQATLEALGLVHVTDDLTSTEAIAGLLRRAAGFMCPCPPRTLVLAVRGSLNGLVASDEAPLEARIEETLDALVALGDLAQRRDTDVMADGRAAWMIYAEPATFVWRERGMPILLGIVPDHSTALPAALARRVEHRGHVRRIAARPGEPLRRMLLEAGLGELGEDTWTKSPPRESPRQLISRINSMLEPVIGEMHTLQILDPSRPVRYYNGRWQDVNRQSGRFIARRPQAYGARLWGYVELKEGRALRWLEFPLQGSDQSGCDEAWLLQLAIDADRGTPQQYGVGDTSNAGEREIRLFSPIPGWAQRRWDCLGVPVGWMRYRFAAEDVADEIRFLRDRLWLAPQDQETSIVGEK